MSIETGNTGAIRASQVIGADLYNSTGEKIGKVEDVILEKTSNRTMFAVVRVGGAVTTSDSYYALPWSVLSYQEAKGGYVVPFSKDQIVRGPGVSIFDLTEVDGADRRVEAYSHYEVAKDW